MDRKGQANEILGDVIARENVRISKKGGSMTAILKKPLRETLGDVGSFLSAATVEFATGQTLVLLSGAPDDGATDSPVHVRKVGLNRFEIEIEAIGYEEVDEITAAFLRLNRDLFAKGKLGISKRMTAADWRDEMNPKIEAVEAALKCAGADLDETNRGSDDPSLGRRALNSGARRKYLSALRRGVIPGTSR